MNSYLLNGHNRDGDPLTWLQQWALLASFPVPRPAFRRCLVRFTVLQATKSWAWDWERG